MRKSYLYDGWHKNQQAKTAYTPTIERIYLIIITEIVLSEPTFQGLSFEAAK